MMHNYLTHSDSLQPAKTVSVVGARGYSGLELSKLLLKHGAVKFTHAFATGEFNLVDELLIDSAKNVVCLKDTELFANLTDIVFLATPAEVSVKLAPQILAQGKYVIDLSGAFRLKKNDYKKWYNFEHSEKAWLANADYGLVPFCGPGLKSKLIANPGCYATAIALGLTPLLKNRIVDSASIVIDAKSGTSGAGKKALESLLFTEVDGDCLPYKVGKHQHLPEIQEGVEAFSGIVINPHFATHLLPTPRGITAAIYLNTLSSNASEIAGAYYEAYASYPLVRVSDKISGFSSLKKVVGTPYTHISYELNGTKLYVFVCIDNLLKGAASQAIENLNRILDLPVAHTLGGTLT